MEIFNQYFIVFAKHRIEIKTLSGKTCKILILFKQKRKTECKKLAVETAEHGSIFLQRGRIACNAERCISHGNSVRPSVCPFVCLCVCLSHAGTLSR